MPDSLCLTLFNSWKKRMLVDRKTCPVCRGQGEINLRRKGDSGKRNHTPCKKCDGDGYVKITPREVPPFKGEDDE